MDNNLVISKINAYLRQATLDMTDWLLKILPQISDKWWDECVIDKLSFNQKNIMQQKNITKLEEFDLAALLRIADRNWYAIGSYIYVTYSERENIRAMMKVRNNWAHCASSLPGKDDILNDMETIIAFMEQYSSDKDIINDAKTFANEIKATEFCSEKISANEKAVNLNNAEIKENDMVRLISQPDKIGIVNSVESLGSITKYEVFIDGVKKVFFTGQIELVNSAPKYNWINLSTLQSYLSAYEINNPSSGSLYSLNAARIDFVPYQFRPALKLIKSDEPRILIADSVGVGKTIEAGLIIKELEARNNLENVMIICPKPLVTERKWELEMKRFDEDFEPLDGQKLRQIISDTDRDGEWPVRYNKTIVPYSILDSRTYNGEEGKINTIGLSQLDPMPHFDLIIIDEAHHIRNGSMEKDRAFAYKCIKTLCDAADAVVMLTATPLQTGDDDLFTLLNVLRPDIVMDKAVFTLMSQPNAHISKCAAIIRHANEDWQLQAIEELNRVMGTQWGESVIAENPLFQSVMDRLEQDEVSRDDRVKLITDVESLHSFNNMINRTRRKDIQDFCVRRTSTLEVDFTNQQKELHDELLSFEKAALSMLHNDRSVPFMMSTIKRQAASCIFGLAPHIEGIIERRFTQLSDEYIDMDSFEIDSKTGSAIHRLASRVLDLAGGLSDEDPKFDKMLEIISKKQKEENNKIIIFSTFRHTLYYIKDKLKKHGYRVEHVDGGIKDEDRIDIRNRFQLPKEDDKALDIVLFTEVGSEGLDYQFCNMMINYDLPWNPMRIEQRIGRIDRRGQESEFVNIYNMITSDTVDADIYNRCLLRIGVFEKSIGECEEILGGIGKELERIAMDGSLTDEERRIKIEQMADNEIRKVQELNKLEDEQKDLFGFDLSSKSMADEIQRAESPWLSPRSLQVLVEMYLEARSGKKDHIIGEGPSKKIRLAKSVRTAVREDYLKLGGVANTQRKKWDAYLKGNDTMHDITFDAEYAKMDKNVFFITPMHPLVKQAARYFSTNEPVNVSVSYSTDEIAPGKYNFAIYAWNYIGENPRFELKVIGENSWINDCITDIIQSGSNGSTDSAISDSIKSELEGKHAMEWFVARQNYLDRVKESTEYRINSLNSNFTYKKRLLEQQIEESVSDEIRQMKTRQLENETEKVEDKIEEVKRKAATADILTSLVANGLVYVQ